MSTQFTERAIQDFLKTHLANRTGATPDQIDIHMPLSTYRLDSVVVVGLSMDLEEWLNYPVDPSAFWQFDTLADLSAWLVRDYLPTLT